MLNQNNSSRVHITPLRIRSVGRESFNSHNTSVQTSLHDYQQQLEQNLIGLRINKNHVSCVQPTARSFQPPPSVPANFPSDNSALILNLLNSELQRFIDVELKGTLNNMKQEQQQQQFEFEREICDLIAQIKTDGSHQEFHSKCAQQKELKGIEEFSVKMAEQMEDHVNAHQLNMTEIIKEINSQIVLSQQAIGNIQSQQKQIAETVGERIDQLYASLYQSDQKFMKYDEQIETQFKNLDRLQDDIENLSRNLTDDLNQKVEQLQQQIIEDDAQNQHEHKEIINNINNIESRLQRRIEVIEKKLSEQNTNVSAEYSDQQAAIHNNYLDEIQFLKQKLSSLENNVANERTERTDCEQHINEEIMSNQRKNQNDIQILQNQIDDLIKQIERLERSKLSAESFEEQNETHAQKIYLTFNEFTINVNEQIEILKKKVEKHKVDNSQSFKIINDINQEQNEAIKDINIKLIQLETLLQDQHLLQSTQIETAANNISNLDMTVKDNYDEFLLYKSKIQDQHHDLSQQKDLSLEEKINILNIEINRVESCGTEYEKQIKLLQEKVESNILRIDSKDFEQDERLDQLEKDFDQVIKDQEQISLEQQSKLEQLKKEQEKEHAKLQDDVLWQCQKQIEASTIKLNEEIEQAKNDIVEQQKLIDELKSEYAEKITAIQQKDETQDEQISALQSQQKEANSIQEILQQDFDLLKQDVNKYSKEFEDLRLKIENLQKSIQNHNEEIEDFKNEIENLKLNKERMQKEIDTLKQEIEALKQQYEEIREQGGVVVQNPYEQIQLQDSENQELVSVDQYAKLEEKIKILQTNILDNDAKISELNTDLKYHVERIDDVDKQQNDQLEAINEQIDANIARIDLKDDEQDQHILLIFDSLNNFTRIDEVDELQNQQIAALKTQLQELQISHQTLGNEVQEALELHRQDLANKIEDVQNQIQLKHQQDIEEVSSTLKTQVMTKSVKKSQKLAQANIHNPLDKRIEALEVQLGSHGQNLDNHKLTFQEFLQSIQIEENNLNSQNNNNAMFDESLNQRLQNEMRRKKLWFLRKTPQDHHIEDLMLKNQFSQEEAEAFYLSQLDKNKLLRTPVREVSPERSSNQLGIKSVNENIIHASSPNTGGGAQGDQIIQRQQHLSVSRQDVRGGASGASMSQYLGDDLMRSNSPLRPGSSRQDAMRGPSNIFNHQSVIETVPDYQEGEEQNNTNNYNSNLQVSPRYVNRKQSSRMAYMVIKSPIHEEVIDTQQIPFDQTLQRQTFNNNNQSSFFKSNNEKYLHIPANSQRFENQQIFNIKNADVGDESNIDIDDLDKGIKQMRSNLSILTPQQKSNKSSIIERPQNYVYGNQQLFSRSPQEEQKYTEETSTFAVLKHNNDKSIDKMFQASPFSVAKSSNRVDTPVKVEETAKLASQNSFGATNSKVNIPKYKVQEVEEEWGDEGDFGEDQPVLGNGSYRQYYQTQEKLNVEYDMEKLDQIDMEGGDDEHQVFSSQKKPVVDSSYKGSQAYDYQESIKKEALSRFQSENKAPQEQSIQKDPYFNQSQYTSQFEDEEQEDSEQFGAIDDLL